MTKEIPSEILKAHRRAAELQKKVGENSRFSQDGMEVATKAPPGMRGAASRAERTLGKTIKKHFPNHSLQESVDLRHALQEHEQKHWKND